MKLLNKKGGEKILSIWWFMILIIVGTGIFFGVGIFYSADLDIKQIEAEALYQKLAECFIEDGFLVEVNQENVLEKCGLSGNAFGEGSDFYFKVQVFDESGEKLKNETKKGAVAFEEDCEISLDEETKAKNYPGCIKRKEKVFYYVGEEIKIGSLEILTASDQTIVKVMDL